MIAEQFLSVNGLITITNINYNNKLQSLSNLKSILTNGFIKDRYDTQNSSDSHDFGDISFCITNGVFSKIDDGTITHLAIKTADVLLISPDVKGHPELLSIIYNAVNTDTSDTCSIKYDDLTKYIIPARLCSIKTTDLKLGNFATSFNEPSLSYINTSSFIKARGILSGVNYSLSSLKREKEYHKLEEIDRKTTPKPSSLPF